MERVPEGGIRSRQMPNKLRGNTCKGDLALCSSNHWSCNWYVFMFRNTCSSVSVFLQGVRVDTCRVVFLFSATCPPTQVWSMCKRIYTCSTIHNVFMTPCVPGCACPTEKPILQNGKCIARIQCSIKGKRQYCNTPVVSTKRYIHISNISLWSEARVSYPR